MSNLEMRYDIPTAISRARELANLKVPYVHQGRTLVGIDCVGLIVYATEFKGIVPSYPRDPFNGELEKEMTRVMGAPILEKVNDTSLLKEGDIVAMQYAGPIRHVAMIANHISIPGAISVIHTDSMLERVTEHILDVKWLRRIAKVWRQ